MKRVGIAAAVLALLVLGWLVHRNPAAPGAASEAPPTRPGTVSIDDAGRGHIDLATAALEPARSEGALDVQGRVLDPIPLLDALLARASARAASEPARHEFERVRALSRDAQNASQRDLEAAEAAWRRAQLDQDAAQARLIAGYGVELAARPDLEALVASLASRKAALARVELPAGVAAPGPPSGLQLRSVTGTKREWVGALVGEAPTTDPQLQGRGWLALIEHEPPAPGTALAGRLELPDLARTGLRVPEDAVVRQDGAAFVYVEISHNVFERRSVALERALPGAWLGSGAIAAGDAVVVRGAQELLSAERGVAHAGD